MDDNPFDFERITTNKNKNPEVFAGAPDSDVASMGLVSRQQSHIMMDEQQGRDVQDIVNKQMK